VGFDEDDGESTLAAVGCVQAICRIVDAAKNDQANLQELQKIVYPILMHGLTPDGMDVVEDCLHCINMLVYYGTPKGQCIPVEMWTLLPQVMYMVAGSVDDVDGGYGFEYLNLASPIVQNFIAKDPATFMTVGPEQTMTYLDLTFKFIQRLLVVNSNGAHKLDGINAMKVLIALMENMPGMIDHKLPEFVGMLLAEL
jgi:hypothetical protein